MLEFPNDKLTCIIELKSVDWYEVLRFKMSYAKWHKEYPTNENILHFFKSIKSDSNTLEHLCIAYYDMLQKPSQQQFKNTSIVQISDYLDNNITAIKDTVTNYLNWKWNDDLSNKFHQFVVNVNSPYLEWLDNMKYFYLNIINHHETSVSLIFWEKAILIAMLCKQHNIHPSKLHWNDYGCFLSDNNVSLIKSLQRIQHGKTI
jgi:hypothetical protein